MKSSLLKEKRDVAPKFMIHVEGGQMSGITDPSNVNACPKRWGETDCVLILFDNPGGLTLNFSWIIAANLIILHSSVVLFPFQ